MEPEKKKEKEQEREKPAPAKVQPKPYQPKVPYPQRLKKEKMQAQYGKFLDMIKQVRLNVPLVDMIAGMPNYEKFIKDLVANKTKLEEVSSAVLNEECSTILQSNMPPKLGDPGSFTISCFVGNTIVCDALADLGESINLMPSSLYDKLGLGDLQNTRMTIQLPDKSIEYLVGIAENVPVKVDKFVFLVDFVILDMAEERKVPLILGRPFLSTADAIIHVSKKQLNLGIADERVTFSIEKSMKYTVASDDTCYFLNVIDPCIESEIDSFLETGNTEGALSIDEDFSQDPEKVVKEIEELLNANTNEPQDPDLKFEEIREDEKLRVRTSLEEPPTLELKQLPDYLECAYLQGKSSLSVIMLSHLSDKENARILEVLKAHKKGHSLENR